MLAAEVHTLLLHLAFPFHNTLHSGCSLLSRWTYPMQHLLHIPARLPQVAEMKAEVTKLKDELAPVYKDKARLTEELMQCRETLSRVRDINEKHSKALDEATSRIRDLQARNKELSQQVDTERATQALAASELEVSEPSVNHNVVAM